MNQRDLINIVIPVYNASKYINECIDSILAQTYQNFEIILVDDGSTDNSAEIIQSYKDDRIRLIRNSHDYIHSLNLGMNKAKGKYIARMDSDDIMLPNRLEVQYKFMEEHPEVDVCGGGAQHFGDSTKLISVAESHIDIVSNMILFNPMIHPTIMMRQQVVSLFPKIDDVHLCYYPDYKYAEDYKLWTELAVKGCHFANIADIILKYRVGKNQITHQKYDEMMKCSNKISVKYLEFAGELMINSDPAYESILEETVVLYNNKKVNFATFRFIYYQMFKNVLSIIYAEKNN